MNNKSKPQRAIGVLCDHARWGGTLKSWANAVGLETSDLSYYRKQKYVQDLMAQCAAARMAEAASNATSSSSSTSSTSSSSNVYSQTFKEGTIRVAKGETPALVAADLAAKHGSAAVSKSTLYNQKNNSSSIPGASPPRTGRSPRVPKPITDDCLDYALFLRKLKYTVLRRIITGHLITILSDADNPPWDLINTLLSPKSAKRKAEDASKDGAETLADVWYWTNIHTAEGCGSKKIRPLAVVRAMWTTSENIDTHYTVLMDLLLVLKIAIHNEDYDSTFDPTKDESRYEDKFMDPRCQPIIIVKPGRLFSMDETDLNLDQSKGTSDATLRSFRGPKDDGEAIVNKSSVKASGLGGCVADGNCLSPYFVFKGKSIKFSTVLGIEGKFKGKWKGPVGTMRIPNPEKPGETMLAPSGAWCNEKASFDGEVCEKVLIHVKNQFEPPPSAENPVCGVLDGVRTHLALRFLQLARDNHIHLVLRPPNTTHKTQPEDVLIFFNLKRLFRAAKTMMMNQRLKKFMTSGKTRPTLPKLALVDMMELLRDVWSQAFERSKVLKAWRMVGVVPFSRKLYWTLKAEEDARESNTDTRSLIAGAHRAHKKIKKTYTTVNLNDDEDDEDEDEIMMGTTSSSSTRDEILKSGNIKAIHNQGWSFEGGVTAPQFVEALEMAEKSKVDDEARKATARADKEQKHIVDLQMLRLHYVTVKMKRYEDMQVKDILAHLLVKHSVEKPKGKKDVVLALLKSKNTAVDLAMSSLQRRNIRTAAIAAAAESATNDG